MEEETTTYQVHYNRFYHYRNTDNYHTDRTDDDMDDYLSADSVEELYELMAKLLIDWQIKGEEGELGSGIEGTHVEFSPIYIYVDEYSEERLKATKTYQEIGLVRDIAKEKRLAKEKADALKRAENERIRKEKFDRDEYERLKRKFKS